MSEGRKENMNGKDEEKLNKTERAAWIQGVVRDFVTHSPENTLKNQAKDRAFEEVIVGFSRADDPLYESYKEVVAPFHWTPLEIFRRTFPGVEIEPGDLTVIAWVVGHRIADEFRWRGGRMACVAEVRLAEGCDGLSAGSDAAVGC